MSSILCDITTFDGPMEAINHAFRFIENSENGLGLVTTVCMSQETLQFIIGCYDKEMRNFVSDDLTLLWTADLCICNSLPFCKVSVSGRSIETSNDEEGEFGLGGDWWKGHSDE